MQDIEVEIRQLANKYSLKLTEQLQLRKLEMENDDLSHFLIYQVLGISDNEGLLIDQYQNKGRFLYKYAGSFLESATKLCFKYAFNDSGSLKIPNTLGNRPKTFEIDCLCGTNAIEIKWRDATTDGDHITKEHTRIQVIKNAGFIPVRIMFYYPNRQQAMKIQQALKTLYLGIGGYYYCCDEAWEYIELQTNINLKEILEKIAKEKSDE
ncbi:ApaLI family restriction endonuclease [Helicobacter cappadocius]|uniref:ApaLI family restriction endonuclease n=1 Tax=Helicobacter cappadocius TaxID=3063998 RepID=A0AA90TA00_9HELI|nr:MULTISPECIES: ApaLI family restriction endonuclease [unclassified Helicobacter]MDO7253480.1 ApaLI family restriction endonuclease [Helicobacter sp. faydin-H75]MDP2539407.1 ApaLI family restriction endonuclease [Helicobacter sp. faydin-H76]